MAKPRNLLERVRKICLGFAETTEKEAWGAPTFRVRKKMFAMFVNNHHNDVRVALWLNAADGVQEMLVDADPERFFVPPYQGPFGWIGVRLDGGDDGDGDISVDWSEVAELVEDSYRMSAPKKFLTKLDG